MLFLLQVATFQDNLNQAIGCAAMLFVVAFFVAWWIWKNEGTKPKK